MRFSEMRRKVSGFASISGGRGWRFLITPPSRCSITKKFAPMIEVSSHSTIARGAAPNPSHNRDSTRYSRAISWAEGGSGPNGGRPPHHPLMAVGEAQQVGQVRAAAAKLLDLHRAAGARDLMLAEVALQF